MTPGSLSFGFSKLTCSNRVRMLDSLRGEQRSVANGGTPIRALTGGGGNGHSFWPTGQVWLTALGSLEGYRGNDRENLPGQAIDSS
jgi:hypothetical protein